MLESHNSLLYVKMFDRSVQTAGNALFLYMFELAGSDLVIVLESSVVAPSARFVQIDFVVEAAD